MSETMVVDQATGEVLEESTALVPATNGGSLARFAALVGSPEELEHQQQLMAAYDAACHALIGKNDVQEESGRTFKKKSAWRKLARYFRISTEIVKVEGWWDGDQYKARVIARGTAPWGQVMEAVGGCSTRESRFWTAGPACPRCGSGMWDNRNSDRSQDDFKCKRKSCGARLYPGRYDPDTAGVDRMVPNGTAFAKAEHDCEATAATRATNRVISDLIAAGEVSAEEVIEDTDNGAVAPPHSANTAAPRGTESPPDFGKLVKDQMALHGVTRDELANYCVQTTVLPDEMEQLTQEHLKFIYTQLKDYGRDPIEAAIARSVEDMQSSGAEEGEAPEAETPDGSGGTPIAADGADPPPTKDELKAEIKRLVEQHDIPIKDITLKVTGQPKKVDALTLPEAREVLAKCRELPALQF